MGFCRERDRETSDRDGRAAFELAGGVLQRTVRVLRAISFVFGTFLSLDAELMSHLPVSCGAADFGHV